MTLNLGCEHAADSFLTRSHDARGFQESAGPFQLGCQLGERDVLFIWMGSVVCQPFEEFCTLRIGEKGRGGPLRTVHQGFNLPLRACARQHSPSWQTPMQPAPAYSAAAMRLLTVSAPSVRARYRASDSVSVSKV